MALGGEQMIINSRSGQLSNRLITIAYGLATAIEYRRNVRITEFDDLKVNYTCEVKWPQRVKIKGSVFWAVERDLVEKIRRIWKHFRVPRVVSFWDYRNEKGAERQAECLRAFFSPRVEVLADAPEFCKKYFTDEVVVIGVHVRRGDYSNWQGGKYYYTDDVYNANMKTLEGEFQNKGKKVRFVIFSHEPINLQNFTVQSEVVLSDFNAVQDHWLMSKCDLIMGPPSTFSLWAAFIGKKLLAYIMSPTQCLHVSDFSFKGLKILV